VGNGVNKVTIPVNAMLFRAEGPRVAVVGSDNKIQLRPINIGRDYGATLEILGGVSPNERIVINPADSLDDGQRVNVAQVQPNPQPGQGPQQGSPQSSQPRQSQPGQQSGPEKGTQK
jgi:hypothetical protein